MASMPISSQLRGCGARRPLDGKVIVHPKGVLTWRELPARSNSSLGRKAHAIVPPGDPPDPGELHPHLPSGIEPRSCLLQVSRGLARPVSDRPAKAAGA
jgi:hypothetical protein